MVVIVCELDDLLCEDVCWEFEQLYYVLLVYVIDINDFFFSSWLFGIGWDDLQMVGYVCWYNLQQIFSWLVVMGWQVILYIGVIICSDLLQCFLQFVVNYFLLVMFNSWCFVWYWLLQVSEVVCQVVWWQQCGVFYCLLLQLQLGIWYCFVFSDFGNDLLFYLLLLVEVDFFVCQVDVNEQLDLVQVDSSCLVFSEYYLLYKLWQIYSVLCQCQFNLLLWLFFWNMLIGDMWDINGCFFCGVLLMDNLLGVVDQVWLVGFWLNLGFQGEVCVNGKFDIFSLVLYYLYGLLCLVYWVFWFWWWLCGEILVYDKNLLLFYYQGYYQLLLCNMVVYNFWFFSEVVFIQCFSQFYSVWLQGLDGSWCIKQYLFDQYYGVLFLLVDVFCSCSGFDVEDYQWLMYQVCLVFSVDEVRFNGYWLWIDLLQSNVLVLYEFIFQLFIVF